MISVRLRDAMKRYDVTYAELARRTGLSKTTLESLGSRSSYNPTLQTLSQIRAALGCELSELLSLQEGPMNIAIEEAVRLLEQAVADSVTADELPEWGEKIRVVCEAALKTSGKNSSTPVSSTTVAVLGTLILAKAVDINVEPTYLQSGAGVGGYSARNLCQHALAAHRFRLKLDIGSSGREPLNNQPYFAKKDLYAAQAKARSTAREALDKLVDFAEEMRSIMNPNDAYLILVEYCRQRTVHLEVQEVEFEQRNFDFVNLRNIASNFIGSDSEHGKRAQALVAALLDIKYGSDELVCVGQVHDPDRKFPGDVIVLNPHNSEEIHISYEVRDKQVSEADLFFFMEKLKHNEIQRGAMIALDQSQSPVQGKDSEKYASENNIIFREYIGLSEFMSECCWESPYPLDALYQSMLERLYSRSEELEVSSHGMSILSSYSDT